jgi:nucleoside-diphosphate-sugar epimerase
MEKRGRILVTGAAGYVGSVLCRQLLAAGFEVRGLDSLIFGGQSLLELMPLPAFEFVKGDLRDETLVAKSLSGVDAVVHLAAIVGDPACKQFPDDASQVMDVGSRALYHAAADAGVRHFVFASTCSNYGVMEGDQQLDESSPLNPQSHYARLKVGFEHYLMERSEGLPAWTILRFSTAYGFSPRLRFDLTVNHFTRDLSLGKELLVFGEKLWRPYGHVRDLANSAVLVLEAGGKEMSGKIYNVGDSTENYTKKTLVEEILKLAPQGVVRYGDTASDDLRNYRVNFDRIARELNFSVSRRVPDGIRELNQVVCSGLLSDPYDSIYQNT